MITRQLYESGLYLGPEFDLLPPGPANPEGFWENRRFVRINSRILKGLRGGWDHPPPIPDDWDAEQLQPLRADAEAVLADFANCEPWGWKDPRNCLILPLWQQLLGPTRLVLIVRNPLEVAESLRKRNGFSYALSFSLWHTYYKRVCDAVPPHERIVTHYDMFFSHPGNELRRLLAFLDLPVDEDVIARANATVITEGRHFRRTTLDVRKVEASSELIDLYRTLCSEAGYKDDDVTHTRSRRRSAKMAKDELNGFGDDSSPADFQGRVSRAESLHSAEFVRRQLVEARARIAELERIVREQRAALAAHDPSERPSTIPKHLSGASQS